MPTTCAPRNGDSWSIMKPHNLIIKPDCPIILDLYASIASFSYVHPYVVAADTYSCTRLDSKPFVAMIVMACLDLYVTPVNKQYTSNVHMYNDCLSTLLNITFKHYFYYTLYTYKKCG